MESQAGSRKWFVISMSLLALLVGGSAAAYSMRATDQAVFCGNCHVMAEAARTHKKSVHARLDCNECHAPGNLAEKLPFKAASGMKDIYKNSMSQVAEVIHAGGATRDVVQRNCLRCHSSTLMNVNLEVKQHCTDCHRQVPHSKQLSMDRRTAADE